MGVTVLATCYKDLSLNFHCPHKSSAQRCPTVILVLGPGMRNPQELPGRAVDNTQAAPGFVSVLTSGSLMHADFPYTSVHAPTAYHPPPKSTKMTTKHPKVAQTCHQPFPHSLWASESWGDWRGGFVESRGSTNVVQMSGKGSPRSLQVAPGAEVLGGLWDSPGQCQLLTFASALGLSHLKQLFSLRTSVTV